MLKNLQYCRAVAAILVVLFHAGHTLAFTKYFGSDAYILRDIFRFGGDAGVSFFFVLSGFIIHRVHEKDIGNAERIPEYIFKRLSRIYPIYWIVFAMTFFIALASNSASKALPNSIPVIVKAISLIPQDALEVGGTGAPVISVAWTLQYEMLFYLAFGAVILSRKFTAIFIISYAAAVIANHTIASPPLFISFIGTHHIALFALGIITSASSKKYGLGKANTINLKIMLSILAFVSVAALQNILWKKIPAAVFDLMYGVNAAFIIHIASKTKDLLAKFSGASKFMSLTGDASYSLYLIHFPIISITCKVTSKYMHSSQQAAVLAFIACVFISMIGGLLTHKAIELPIMRRLSRFAKLRWPHNL
jgi:exopolysaccharide production protein ExoZ